MRNLILILILTFLPCQLFAQDSVEKAGDTLRLLLPAAAASLTILLQDKEGALQFGQSMLVTVGVTKALKMSIDAERPNGEPYSFPSGHASISFSSAEYMRKRYGLAYGVTAYSLATFVAYSRVESDNHYTRDVVAGAAIGIASSYYFTKPYKGWYIHPEIDARYFGVKVDRTW